MPRPAKGPRAWLQPARIAADGRVIEQAVWCIRDGEKKHRTGISGADARDASDPRVEAALRNYLAGKHEPPRSERHPSQIEIADVINLYMRDVVPGLANQQDVLNRLAKLLSWWSSRHLSEVVGATCRQYAADRGKPQMARRELEDLRAAINHHRREGCCSEIVSVVLPEKAAPRERWLTREEAARLIWAAWRHREMQKGEPTRRFTRRHIARFILVALYTGSRAAVICGAATAPTEGHGFIDYERGVFYRKPNGARETKKRAPPMRIPARLLAHLRRWRATGISSDFVIEWNGQPVTTIKRALARVVKDAGMEGQGVSAHTFRHTTATWGMQNGADAWQLAGMLGMTQEQLERTYGHHHPDYQLAAGDAVTRRPGAKRGRTDTDRNTLNEAATEANAASSVPQITAIFR